MSQASASQNPDDLENQRSLQAALMMVEDANAAKRNRVKAELERDRRNAPSATNPYSACWKQITGPAGFTRPLKKPFAPTTIPANVVDQCPQASLKSDESGLNVPGDDRIAQLLRRAEGSPFRKGKQKPKLRANIRSSTCRICEQICKEVSKLKHHAMLMRFEHSRYLRSHTCRLAAI
jgi:hypothetical protein